jgi:hypothetical protein
MLDAGNQNAFLRVGLHSDLYCPNLPPVIQSATVLEQMARKAVHFTAQYRLKSSKKS